MPPKYPVPDNEDARNEAVRSYEIMDTIPELTFDDVTELAAQLCECPIAYISFIEEDRFWFKSKYGIPDEFTWFPREIAFCSVTICGADLVNCPDLARDERFSEFPFVVGGPKYRFYCSMPLVNPEGYSVGTLCVMDFVPRELPFEAVEGIRRLSRQVVCQLEHRRKLIEMKELNAELEAARAAVVNERDRAEGLLKNILPEAIAQELKEHGKVEARYHPTATVLFTDFEGFTSLSEQADPGMLVELLDQYFSSFDTIATRHGLEKIKTIGDAFMAVAGVPTPSRTHCIDTCLAALEMHQAVRDLNARRQRLRLPSLNLRVGIHSGPVMAGVIGRHKFTYDVWGDTVNTAARLESHGEPGRTNVSESVQNYVKAFFDLTPRGSFEVKNKGAVQMCFLDRIKADLSANEAGTLANEAFLERRALIEQGRLSRLAPGS